MIYQHLMNFSSYEDIKTTLKNMITHIYELVSSDDLDGATLIKLLGILNQLEDVLFMLEKEIEKRRYIHLLDNIFDIAFFSINYIEMFDSKSAVNIKIKYISDIDDLFNKIIRYSHIAEEFCCELLEILSDLISMINDSSDSSDASDISYEYQEKVDEINFLIDGSNTSDKQNDKAKLKKKRKKGLKP